MTEQEWVASADPAAMLRHLTHKGEHVVGQWGREVERETPLASGRKLRLFACACCRAVWDMLTDSRSRNAVEVAERFADGLATDEERGAANDRAMDGELVPVNGIVPSDLASWVAATDAAEAAESIVQYAERAGLPLAAAAALLRSIAGNPFRPQPKLAGWQHSECKACGAVPDGEGEIRHGKGCYVLESDGGGSEWADPIVTPWLTPQVVSLAAAAYGERWDWCPCFYAGRPDARCQRCHGHAGKGFLDPARLGILSDALEEAGAAGEILTHLRAVGPHARGCWAVDIVLGKS